jgi:hypothetical protein
MVKLYDRTISLLERVAALPLESEPIQEERGIIIEARAILTEIEKVS